VFDIFRVEHLGHNVQRHGTFAIMTMVLEVRANGEYRQDCHGIGLLGLGGPIANYDDRRGVRHADFIEFAVFGRVTLYPSKIVGNLLVSTFRGENQHLGFVEIEFLDDGIQQHACAGIIAAYHQMVYITAHSNLLLPDTEHRV